MQRILPSGSHHYWGPVLRSAWLVLNCPGPDSQTLALPAPGLQTHTGGNWGSQTHFSIEWLVILAVES